MEKRAGKITAAVFLVLLTPFLGELLSGSSPPGEYFTPFTFIVLTVLYGGGALLIREAKARWKLGWSVIFLLVAYGILEEGLMAQSFFNHNHMDLDKLSGYGMFLETQWPWAIQLTLFHAIISTSLPILITDLLFPGLKNKPLLNKPALWICGILLLSDALFFALFVIRQYAQYPEPYVPDALNLLIWTLITGGLVYAAYNLKDKRYAETKKKLLSPVVFGLLALACILLLLFLPDIFARAGAPAAVAVAAELLLACLVLYFVFHQIYHRDITVKHKLAMVCGSVSAFIVISVVQELQNGMRGMILTGFITLALLILFCAVILNRNREEES